MEHFYSLGPEAMLDAVESALGAGTRATGRCLALNSVENRVCDIELEPTGDEVEGRHVVAKFYRPGRWSQDAILEEHGFLAELAGAEVPAVAPLTLQNGSTLAATSDGILFAVFPKIRGRSLQELSDSQLAQVGRFLGRIHNIGAQAAAPHRLQLTAETYGTQALAYLVSSGAIDIQVQSRYERAATAIIQAVTPMLAGVEAHRLHGDCHLANLLWVGEGALFLDFDDMLTGPAVQDIWMVVRGRDAEAERQRSVMLDGYEQIRRFDRTTLRLVEPLRALRMLHFAAWIARRWADPTFQRMFPDFPTYRYWAEETAALEEQLRLVQAASLLG